MTADYPPPNVPEVPRRPATRVFLRLAAICLLHLSLNACNACGPSPLEIRNATIQAALFTHLAHQQAGRMAARQLVEGAVREARMGVSTAVNRFDPRGEAAYRAACLEQLDQGQPEEALECVAEAATRGHRSPDLLLIEARALTAGGRFSEAREELFQLRDEAPSDDRVPALLLAAFAQDPMFLRPVVTLEPGVQTDQLRALGGGSTLTMRVNLEGETIAAFKPDQTRRQSNYRAEVAAFRLCPIIRCGFEIPYSFEARVEQRDFMRLYGIRVLEGQTGYAADFGDLVWTSEEGRQYLYGVWKQWVPHFAKFPIEYDDVWDSWLSTEGDPAELEQPLAQALAPLRGRERGYYDEILQEAGYITTEEFARQISNLLVFDFLINNWDRFSGAYFGVNCQFAEGRFVSIDNGAGFMTREPTRPRLHLHQATRFSASLVREVRALDRDALLPILFPNPTVQEREAYDAFLQRIDEFLQYVDELIEIRGEDAVLFFE